MTPAITRRRSTPRSIRLPWEASRTARLSTYKDAAQALFVTLRTVEMHLSHAYGKLGIKSRAELPQALANSLKTSVNTSVAASLPARPGARMLALMSEANRTVVTAALELQLEEGAPRGSLSYAEGPRIRFTGWTEFASAIENWREEALG